MLPQEVKQSGSKILPNSNRREGIFLEETSSTKKRKMDILLGTWNIRSLYRTGSLRAANWCKLDVVGVQEVGWENRGTERAGDYNFF
jgi:hypothetical protein